ncbi:hypothetical protein E1285_19365 [Actinomadura sp. 7K507]|nr:hypothetical protein E1285_19365 [Actinomadura sp. 7K507]
MGSASERPAAGLGPALPGGDVAASDPGHAAVRGDARQRTRRVSGRRPFGGVRASDLADVHRPLRGRDGGHPLLGRVPDLRRRRRRRRRRRVGQPAGLAGAGADQHRPAEGEGVGRGHQRQVRHDL